jgi:hypothetical protein
VAPAGDLRVRTRGRALTHILPFRWAPDGRPAKPLLKTRVCDIERRTVKALITALRTAADGREAL